ncbi:MAG: hypothetical protein AAFR81_27135 [Chloroflexota bacterium]
MAKRILTPEEMISREEFLEERRNYTDKQARALGYANAEVLRLSDKLTALAGQWRNTKDAHIAVLYRETLMTMILKGYDVDTLPVQDQLPKEHMPDLPPNPVLQAILQANEEINATSS